MLNNFSKFFGLILFRDKKKLDIKSVYSKLFWINNLVVYAFFEKLLKFFFRMSVLMIGGLVTPM